MGELDLPSMQEIKGVQEEVEEVYKGLSGEEDVVFRGLIENLRDGLAFVIKNKGWQGIPPKQAAQILANIVFYSVSTSDDLDEFLGDDLEDSDFDGDDESFEDEEDVEIDRNKK
jgi:hypothetical protein